MNHGRKTERREGGPDIRALAALKLRALLKLWLATILMTEFLSAIFSWALDQLDFGASSLPALMFTFATSALVSRWLIIDAARAWSSAREHGYVYRDEKDGHATLEVRKDCPKRWLVELHAGLNPGLVIKR